MSTQIKFRRGTTVQHNTFTGVQGELTVDTNKNTVVVHDGVTAGGFPLAKSVDLGVGKTSVTGSAILPKGTTAQRDVLPEAGYTRFNTTTGQWEGYDGSVWTSLGDITTANSLAGGSVGTIPYQTSPGVTAMLPVGVSGQLLESAGAAPPIYTYRRQLQDIDYTLAANALTLKLNPTTLEFRSTVLTTGTPVKISNAAQITTTISSGSTGGTISAIQSDIIILAINNAGTMELAWTNLAGGTNLDETGLISTVAEGGTGLADSATTVYSTTTRANVAYRIVGIFRSTQTTAGTWAQTPILVQGYGGLMLSSINSWGFNQSMTDVTTSRAFGGVYTNSKTKPIWLHINWHQLVNGAGPGGLSLTIDGITQNSPDTYCANTAYGGGSVFMIPPGKTYSITQSGAGGCNLSKWYEIS